MPDSERYQIVSRIMRAIETIVKEICYTRRRENGVWF